MRKQQGFGLIEIIIVIGITILLAAGAWLAWQAQNKPTASQQNESPQNNSQTNSEAAFKIPELNVGFNPKPTITPLYSIQDYSLNNTPHKLIHMSTQQLVDKGSSADTSRNLCEFKSGAWQNSYHSLLTVAVYNSSADLLAVEKEVHGNITTADIKAQNGYFNIDGKYYAVPHDVQRGSGFCTEDSAFQSQQWTLLRDSLMSIRSAK